MAFRIHPAAQLICWIRPIAPAAMRRFSSDRLCVQIAWNPTSTHLPVRLAAASISSTSWIVAAGGFSRNTWYPLCMAAMVNSVCVWMGVATVTASIRPRMASYISRTEPKTSTPWLRRVSSRAGWFSGSITAVATIWQAPRRWISSKASQWLPENPPIPMMPMRTMKLSSFGGNCCRQLYGPAGRKPIRFSGCPARGD